METLTQSVVVFSKNYLPLNKVNLKRAIAERDLAKPVRAFSYGES
jgi:hypothetical protein